MPPHHRETSDQKRLRKRPARRDRQVGAADAGRTVSDSGLADLVERIAPANRHEEVDWGPPVGKEVW